MPSQEAIAQQEETRAQIIAKQQERIADLEKALRDAADAFEKGLLASDFHILARAVLDKN